MDFPFTCSDDANGMHKSPCSAPYVNSAFYSSNSMMLNTPCAYGRNDMNGDSCQNFKLSWAEPPVEIHEECTTDIDLPPLVWHGYDIIPKLLSVCNTGRTISVNGHWTNGRPYIEGGPLNGKYIFSQIHFHCPSEHEIDGRRYPLEMHVVHYKNSYLTQERAMHEKDGTLVLVYLFQVVESEETILSEITKMGNCLENPNARIEMNKIPLCNLVKPFFCNYYVYWGSVMMKKNSYILQWIINCIQSQVTKEEVDTLLNVMSNNAVMANKGAKMKPHNSIIYRVGENYDIREPTNSVDTETSTSMHFDIVIKTDSGSEINQPTQCSHISAHPHLHSPCTNIQQQQCTVQHSQHPLCSNCAVLSTSCPIQCSQIKCSMHGSENRCTHVSDEVTMPTFVCTCKEKPPKVCSSCGGSKSGISWCKRKWKQCASKCSFLSRTCSCSDSDTSSKKCAKKSKKKKQLKKKRSKKKSSDTSVSDKQSDVEGAFPKSTECDEEKCETNESCPEKTPPSSKKRCKSHYNSADVEPCEKCPSAVCTSTSSSTPCVSVSELCAKKLKKPKLFKRKSVTSVKKTETTKTEKTDVDCSASKKSLKKATKTSSKKKNDEITGCETDKKGKTCLKSKDTLKAEEQKFEKDCKKTKCLKKKKKQEEECDEITTLFVKVPENIFPPFTKSSLSCSEEGINEKKEDDNEEESESNNLRDREYIVNTLTTSGLKIPEYDVSSTSKELYLQMKHSFQSDSASVSQELQVSIVCDSNILQEYKGLFQPQEISLGSFEKLQLVPKYQEPDDLSVQLQECVIKKSSLDKFCIDSKFLLKGLNPKDVFPRMKKECFKDLKEKMLNNIFDAETQCSKQELEVTSLFPISWECHSVQTDEMYVPVTDKIKRIFCKKLDLKSQNVQTEPQDDEQKNKNAKDLLKCKTRLLKTTSEPEFLTASKRNRLNQYINLMEAKLCKSANANKLSEKLECKIKLIKNPQTSLEGSEVDSSSKLTQKKDMDKNGFEVAQRNTVYFMYDRIEKDPLTGKKIFMGRFRTKDDLKILKEHKITSKADSLRSFGSRTTNEDSSSASSRLFNIERISDSYEKKRLSQEIEDEVSIHKFEPKCLELTQFKTQNSNLIPDVVKWFQEDGQNFDHLADIFGFVRKEKPKNSGLAEMTESVYELNGFTEKNTRRENSSLMNAFYQDKATMCSTQSSSSQNFENSMALKSLDSDAVIIVPVEVESWSKIEVVLIERSHDQEAIKGSKKYIPLI